MTSLKLKSINQHLQLGLFYFKKLSVYFKWMQLAHQEICEKTRRYSFDFSRNISLY